MEKFAAGAIIMAIVLCTIFEISTNCINNSWRDQIVAHGAAEYYLDSNHNRQWRWIECGDSHQFPDRVLTLPK